MDTKLNRAKVCFFSAIAALWCNLGMILLSAFRHDTGGTASTIMLGFGTLALAGGVFYLARNYREDLSAPWRVPVSTGDSNA